MLVSMLFLLLLRFTAPVMVWLLIIGLLAAGAYGKPAVSFFPDFNTVPSMLSDSKCVKKLLLCSLWFRGFCVAGIWHCYWEYDQYRAQGAKISDVGFTTNVKIYLQVQETWLAFCEFDSKPSCRIFFCFFFLLFFKPGRKKILSIFQ